MTTAQEIYNKVMELKTSYYATMGEWIEHGAYAWISDDLDELQQMIDKLDAVTDTLKDVIAYENETEEN